MTTAVSRHPFLSIHYFLLFLSKWSKFVEYCWDYRVLFGRSSKTCASVITISGLLLYHPKGVATFLLYAPLVAMPAFKLLFLHGKCPSPYSIVSLPRRSTSSFILNQQSSSPRHPVTFYVDVHSGVNSLEHLLVYTPSGYVIKLELLPSIEAELNESDLATRSGSYVHSQDEE
ncbi:unnamed protein product [Ilex paraguariensis]|uniref:Uncharacterized protein n=1 Tax=Ilex paraguariensis TaxID=185542 RepID=A0ABC8TAH8_9AQUA